MKSTRSGNSPVHAAAGAARHLALAGALLYALATPGLFALAAPVRAAVPDSLARSLRPDHPRIWMRGADEWYRNETGTLAWRILHGAEQPWPWNSSPANDQSKAEFSYTAGADEDADYGADNMFNRYDHDFAMRVLEPVIAGKAQKWNWRKGYQGQWTLGHTADEYFADARAKLLYILEWPPEYEFPYVMALVAATAYDWLIDETFSSGQPVLSEQDKQRIRERLIVHADYLKSRADGSGHPFTATDVDNFFYVMMGFALYEPTRAADPAYQAINSKALEYLNAFERDFIGQVLPFWEKQSADGGWPGGFNQMQIPFWTGGSYESADNVAFLTMAPVLFAAWTATTNSLESSLFNIGPLKYMPEFQLHMILPSPLDAESDATYYDINGSGDPYSRSPWILPMRAYSRRRFADSAEQQQLAELGAWVRAHFSGAKTNAGSWDMTDQLLFEDKWVNPREPVAIGFPLTRYFRSLGWIFMRTGFASPDDLAALFISQPYHWSALDPYAQNSLLLWYKGPLLRGYTSPLLIDNAGQRSIDRFPAIQEGAAQYAPGSLWDVGPGIIRFEETPQYLQVVADASHAYVSDQLASCIRQVIYLKPDRFLVVDRIRTVKAGVRKTWTLRTAAQFQSFGPDLLRLQNSGGGALWMKRLSPLADLNEAISSQNYSLTEKSAAATRFIHLFQVCDAAVTASSAQLLVDDAVLKGSADTLTIVQPDCDIILYPDDRMQFLRHGSAVTPGPLQGAAARPHRFMLLQNYPNPFNPDTAISLQINDAAGVVVEVYSVNGALQSTLFSGRLAPGLHLFHWNGEDSKGAVSPSGVYFCRVSSGPQETQSCRMLLLH